MTNLIEITRQKQSFLCVGLDTDLQKIPTIFRRHPDEILAFNKAIIEATSEFAVAYKLNIAFYECWGVKGWEILEKTLEAIPKSIFTVADAKRGDIDNTARMYARTFFETYPFNSITVAPYMGEDSVKPFLEYEHKGAFVLGLTSNKGSSDFQKMQENGEFLYERVIRKSLEWGQSSKGEVGFVVGATQGKDIAAVRAKAPDSWLLVPGVGAQGGNLTEVCEYGINEIGGLLINASRSILYADNSSNFAEAASKEAQNLQQQMKQHWQANPNRIKNPL